MDGWHVGTECEGVVRAVYSRRMEGCPFQGFESSVDVGCGWSGGHKEWQVTGTIIVASHLSTVSTLTRICGHRKLETFFGHGGIVVAFTNMTWGRIKAAAVKAMVWGICSN
jgi:hypothetical protein